MVKTSKKVSIVIPAYNEEKNFRAGLLNPMISFLEKQKYTFEVIFVDDGSTDKTKSLVQDLSKKISKPGKTYRVLSIPHGGKAAAVKAGMLDGVGEIILFTDFDQSTPISNLDKFLKAHEKGADVVIGVRGEGAETKKDTIFRRFRSWGFVFYVQIVALPGISDTQCGFKSFKHDVAKKIFSNLRVTFKKKVSGGYMGAFDVEALFIAKKLHCTIVQIPVSWVKVYSEKLNIWREPLQMAIDTLNVRIAGLSGKYDNI